MRHLLQSQHAQGCKGKSWEAEMPRRAADAVNLACDLFLAWKSRRRLSTLTCKSWSWAAQGTEFEWS